MIKGLTRFDGLVLVGGVIGGLLGSFLATRTSGHEAAPAAEEAHETTHAAKPSGEGEAEHAGGDEERKEKGSAKEGSHDEER